MHTIKISLSRLMKRFFKAMHKESGLTVECAEIIVLISKNIGN